MCIRKQDKAVSETSKETYLLKLEVAKYIALKSIKVIISFGGGIQIK